MYKIYGTEGCVYCDLAKEYLGIRGVDYEYIDLAQDLSAVHLFKKRGWTTVPQVFLDDKHIGGYNELRRMP